MGINLRYLSYQQKKFNTFEIYLNHRDLIQLVEYDMWVVKSKSYLSSILKRKCVWTIREIRTKNLSLTFSWCLIYKLIA